MEVEQINRAQTKKKATTIYGHLDNNVDLSRKRKGFAFTLQLTAKHKDASQTPSLLVDGGLYEIMYVKLMFSCVQGKCAKAVLCFVYNEVPANDKKSLKLDTILIIVQQLLEEIPHNCYFAQKTVSHTFPTLNNEPSCVFVKIVMHLINLYFSVQTEENTDIQNSLDLIY